MFAALLKGTHRKQVLVNTGAQLFGKIASTIATFALSFVLARVLGASGFGEYVTITTYVSFFFLIADFGLNAQALQRTDKSGFAQLFSLRVFGSCLLIFVALAILSLIPQQQSSGYTMLVRFGIILFIPAIFFQSMITTANAVFQKNLRYDFAALAQMLGSVITLLVVWFIWITPPSSSTIFVGLVALLLGGAATAAVGMLFAHRLNHWQMDAFPGAVRGLFLPAIPLGLTLISNIIYAHADSVILALSRSSADVGTYGLAYKIFETILVVPTFFMNALYPLLLAHRSDKKKYWSFIRKAALILLGLSLICVIATWVGSPWIPHIKNDFVASIVYIRILALGFPIFFLSSLTMWVLVTAKKQWGLALIYGVGMVINIGSNILLVPTYGPAAAAWITVISEGLILVASAVIVIKQLSNSSTS
jgi:O-antigen/teichoic acid export membrane protein